MGRLHLRILTLILLFPTVPIASAAVSDLGAAGAPTSQQATDSGGGTGEEPEDKGGEEEEEPGCD